MQRVRGATSAVSSLASACLLASFCVPPLGAADASDAPPPSRSQRLARILELEDQRTGADELTRLLRDPDAGVRRRAALAAGRLGDSSLVRPLLTLLDDREYEVRRVACFALGLAGDRAAVERLRAALDDADPGVRGRAAEALGRLGESRLAGEIAKLVVDSLPKTISRMTVRGDDPGNPQDTWMEQRLALTALALLQDAAAAETVLLADGRPRFDWWAATWLATRVASPSLRPVLVAAAGSDDPRSRALAARGLGKARDASAVELLLGLARDRKETVAVEALRALAASGDARGTRAAADLLGSRSDLLRREALVALAALPADPALRPRIVALVADRDAWVRAAAFGALARTSPDDFALVLSGLDADPAPEVRRALALALGAAGGEMSVSLLHTMLRDDDPRVVEAVLEGLRQARGKDALDTLLRHLEHRDLGVRAAAAAQIQASGALGAAPALLAAWQRGLEDGGQIEARLAALVALASCPEAEGGAAVARIAREDPSRAVRARAALLLREKRLAAPDVGGEAVERPALDWREAMAPYGPRAGRSLYTPRALLHTRKGTIEIRLDVVETPLATASFVALARRGFYDGASFHRLEPGFVVQGGDPRGDGNGGPGYTLRDEPGLRSFGRGAVGMALSGKDTGGSQFFVTLEAAPQLDGGYTLFGWVAAGMDVVDTLRPGDRIDHVEVWTGD